VAAPGRARQDWTTWSDEDTTRSVETTFLDGGRVVQRADAHSPWIALAGREAHEAAATIWSSVPALMAARAAAANGRGLGGAAVSPFQSTFSWPESLGRAVLDLGALDEPTVLDLTREDPWRGTLSQATRYFDDTTAAGRAWPGHLLNEGYPADVAWRSDERRIALEEPVALATLALPDSVRAPAPAPRDTTPRVARLARGVWSVELPDADTRSLVLEFADHLVVLETSTDVPHGERLRAAIRARLPGKRIRYVLFGHHHPAYTGGLRAFMADSATVVCAGSNAAYVREIAMWHFTQSPDRLTRLAPAGFRPRVDTLAAGRWRHADATNELVAIDVGPRSQHTDAYLVFWLPRARLLFEGDLGWFTSDGTLRASRRAAGLLAGIDEAGIRPLTVVQGWPVNGNAASLTLARLRALAATRDKP
jgi:glyoxylase-like metal-dependent hydrolase (beta-lactamase superfamily II)